MAQLGRRHPAAAYTFIRKPLVNAASVVIPGVPFLPDYVDGYHFGLYIAPGADTTADPATWTLFDVSGDVLQSSGFDITRGRGDEQSTTAPSQIVFTVKNLAGDYTQRRRQSVYYPYMMAGLPVQMFIATATDFFEQFSGKVTEMVAGWDETGKYATVRFTAHGTFHELEASDDTLNTAIYRTMSGRAAVAWWPLEDSTGSGSAASAVNGPAMALSGDVTFGSDAPPGGAGVPNFSGTGQLSGQVFNATTGSFELDFVFRNDETVSSPTNYIGVLEAYSTTARFSVAIDPVSQSLFLWTPAAGYSLSGALPPDGTWHSAQLVFIQTGSDITLYPFIDGVNTVGSQILTGMTVGRATSVRAPARTIFNPAFGTIYSSAVHVGAVAVYSPAVATPPNAVAFGQAVNGYDNERATDRMARLAAELGIPFVLHGTASNRRMGPQTNSTPLSAFREAEAVGGGVLQDGENWGLGYYELEIRYNQTAAMTPTLRQLSNPFNPVEGVQRVVNDVTVTRPGGSSARYVQPAGSPYAPSGPGGIGSRSRPITINANQDSVLYPHASWQVALGTVDADRYAPLTFQFAARTELIADWLACTNGSRIAVQSTFATGGLAPDILIEGYNALISTRRFDVQINGAPASPYNLAITDSSDFGRVEADDTTLDAGIDAAVASFVVDLTYAWSPTGGDYPFDIKIGFERMTLNSVVGTTFGVTRGVGGTTAEAHDAGDSVSLWRPAVASL